jgi:hypothetical protein
VEDWEFEYGAAENDPEFGLEERRDFQDESSEEVNQDTGGKWVHRVTGESLANKAVEFTVIGYVNISTVSAAVDEFTVIGLLWPMKCYLCWVP